MGSNSLIHSCLGVNEWKLKHSNSNHYHRTWLSSGRIRMELELAGGRDGLSHGIEVFQFYGCVM